MRSKSLPILGLVALCQLGPVVLAQDSSLVANFDYDTFSYPGAVNDDGDAVNDAKGRSLMAKGPYYTTIRIDTPLVYGDRDQEEKVKADQLRTWESHCRSRIAALKAAAKGLTIINAQCSAPAFRTVVPGGLVEGNVGVHSAYGAIRFDIKQNVAGLRVEISPKVTGASEAEVESNAYGKVCDQWRSRANFALCTVSNVWSLHREDYAPSAYTFAWYFAGK